MSPRGSDKEESMQRTVFFGAILVAVSVVLLQGVAQVSAAEKTYQMTGTIAAIDGASQTVVVEVPVGKDMFTVGGPLNVTAVLTKGGRSVQLSAFRRGDKVTVTWRSTSDGHVIERLTSM
jgi:hypothetical protein